MAVRLGHFFQFGERDGLVEARENWFRLADLGAGFQLAPLEFINTLVCHFAFAA